MKSIASEPSMSDGGKLFDDVPQPAGVVGKAEKTATLGPARVVMPKRSQVELRPMDLESLLPPGHRARLVWLWVEQQDLSGMVAAIKVREGGKLIHEERAARAGPGGVRHSETDTAVAIGDWSFVRKPETGHYEARIVGRELDLALTLAPAGPPVLQGTNGYSQKGSRPEQASHYYSEAQLKVTGRIATGTGAARRQWQTSGRAWLDHE